MRPTKGEVLSSLSDTRNTSNNHYCVFHHFCCHREQPSILPTMCAWGTRQKSLTRFNVDLFWDAIRAKPNSLPKLGRLFLHLCHLLYCHALRLPPVDMQHCNRLQLNIKQPAPRFLWARRKKSKPQKNPRADNDWLNLAQKSIKIDYLRKNELKTRNNICSSSKKNIVS